MKPETLGSKVNSDLLKDFIGISERLMESLLPPDDASGEKKRELHEFFNKHIVVVGDGYSKFKDAFEGVVKSISEDLEGSGGVLQELANGIHGLLSELEAATVDAHPVIKIAYVILSSGYKVTKSSSSVNVPDISLPFLSAYSRLQYYLNMDSNYYNSVEQEILVVAIESVLTCTIELASLGTSTVNMLGNQQHLQTFARFLNPKSSPEESFNNVRTKLTTANVALKEKWADINNSQTSETNSISKALDNKIDKLCDTNTGVTACLVDADADTLGSKICPSILKELVQVSKDLMEALSPRSNTRDVDTFFDQVGTLSEDFAGIKSSFEVIVGKIEEEVVKEGSEGLIANSLKETIDAVVYCIDNVAAFAKTAYETEMSLQQNVGPLFQENFSRLQYYLGFKASHFTAADQSLLVGGLENVLKCTIELALLGVKQTGNKHSKLMKAVRNYSKNKSDAAHLADIKERLETARRDLKEKASDVNNSQTAETNATVKILDQKLDTLIKLSENRESRVSPAEMMTQLRVWLKPGRAVESAGNIQGRGWFTERVISWWKQKQSKVYWLSGEAGCGKSIMAANVSSHFAATDELPQSFVMHFHHKTNNDPVKLIFNLAFMMAETLPEFREGLFATCHARFSEGDQDQTFQLPDLFNALIVSPLQDQQILLCFDGLDECQPTSRAAFIKMLASVKKPSISFFVTSRPGDDELDQCLRHAEIYEFQSDTSENQQDLQDYSRMRLNGYNYLRKPLKPQIEKIEGWARTIVAESNYSFLTVSLAFDLIEASKPKNFLKFQKEFDQLIENGLSLESLYSRILSRVEEGAEVEADSSSVVSSVAAFLSTLVLLKRPLDIISLGFMVDEEMAEVTVVEQLSWIAPLLKNWNSRDESYIVEIKHKTVYDFLTGPSFKFGSNVMETAATRLSLRCVRALEKAVALPDNDYLAWRLFLAEADYSLESEEESEIPHCVTTYAVNFWIHHWEASSTSLSKEFLTRYGVSSLVAAVALRNSDLVYHILSSQDGKLILERAETFLSENSRSPLIYQAAKLGLTDIGVLLLGAGASGFARGWAPVFRTGEGGRTTAHQAVIQGDLRLVKAMIDVSDVDMELSLKDDFGNSPHEYSTGEVGRYFVCLYRAKQFFDYGSVMNPFFVAVWENKLTASQLEDKGIFWRTNPYDNNNTALHYAAERGHQELVSFFCKSGSAVNAINDSGSTPLHLTSAEGHLEIVACLISSGASIDAVDVNKCTSLHLAAQSGWLVVAKKLLENGAFVDALDAKSGTSLTLAAMAGYLEIVSLLLANGAEVNHRDEDGATALHVAATRNHLQVVSTLLEAGASVDVQSKSGMTPLHNASMDGNASIVALLLKNGGSATICNYNGWSALHMAAYHGHKTIMKLLVEYGADVDSREITNGTPLHMAAQNDHADCALFLLDMGASVDAFNSNMDYPLHLAAYSGHQTVASILIEKGASVECLNSVKETPLLLATLHGHHGFIAMLLEKGVNVEACNSDNWRALHMAGFTNNAQSARALIEHGALVDSLGVEGNTPLHAASVNGCIDSCLVLLEFRANVDSVNDNKTTPLQYASSKGHFAVVRLLIESGANANALDAGRWNAIMYAMQDNHAEVVEYLAIVAPSCLIDLTLSWGLAFECKTCNGTNCLSHYYMTLLRMEETPGIHLLLKKLNEKTCNQRRLSEQELETLSKPVAKGQRKLSAAHLHYEGDDTESITVWDEDDIEALKVAQTLQQHASVLFPRGSIVSIAPSNATSSASNANGPNKVRSLVGAWEARAKSPPLDNALSLRRPLSPPPPVNSNAKPQSSSTSPVYTRPLRTRDDIKATSPLAPTGSNLKAASLTSHRLSIRQSAMLKKALKSMNDRDLKSEDDFNALASVILGTTDDGSSDLDSDSDEEGAEVEFIDSYFASIEKQRTPIPTPSIPKSVAVPTRADSAEPVLLPKRSASAIPTPPPRTVLTKISPLSLTFGPTPPLELKLSAPASPKKPFMDIHDPPRRPSQVPTTPTTEVEYQPPSVSLAKNLMQRRMTVKKVDSIRKHASTMNASKLILELDTVMFEMKQFGVEDEVGLGLGLHEDEEDEGEGDDQQEDIQRKDEDNISSAGLVGNGWGFDEDEATTNDKLERKTPDSDPDLTTQSSVRHPAHLVRHLDRASVYTNSEVATDELMERMDSVQEEEEEEEDLTSELSILQDSPRQPAIFSSARIGSPLQQQQRDKRYLEMPNPSGLNSSARPNPPSNEQPTSPTRSGTIKRNGMAVFPSPPASVHSQSSGHSTETPNATAQRPILKRNVTTTPPPLIPSDISRPSSPFHPQSPSFFSKQSTTPTMSMPSISSPAPHYHTLTRSMTTLNSKSNTYNAADSSLLNSEDDPDAISGQLKLHTSKMFNAWQEIVLVLSPRKRGLYYVKTGKGAGRTEQVVGFIELNHLTQVESIGKQTGVASVFRGKPTFRVVKVKELENGVLRKEYFYFLARENEDRDRWVDAMQGFVETLSTLEAQGQPSASIYTMSFHQPESRSVTPNYYTSLKRQKSILTQEDISIQLQKQQKLLAQQRALMAAVAAQLQLQQEITAELQAAQQDSQQRRLSIQTGGTGGSGSNDGGNGVVDSGIGSSQQAYGSGNGREYSLASTSNSTPIAYGGGGGGTASRQFQHMEPLHSYPETSRAELERRVSNTSSDILDPYNLLGRKRSMNQFSVQQFEEPQQEFVPSNITKRGGESMQRIPSSPSPRVGSPLDHQRGLGVPMARSRSGGIRAGSPMLNAGTRSYTMGGGGNPSSRPASPLYGASKSFNLGDSGGRPVSPGVVGNGTLNRNGPSTPMTKGSSPEPAGKKKMFPLFGRAKSTNSKSEQ
ncbi:UNVERIFIED_CONTAM: hypothetical protein HDU68_007481 [Siphonaria sp. JEL0065]|nr:hypothetical protein HDU68_007481 [Siphonaria sp. JEL0065]